MSPCLMVKFDAAFDPNLKIDVLLNHNFVEFDAFHQIDYNVNILIPNFYFCSFESYNSHFRAVSDLEFHGLGLL